jgi:hypothetical protein
MIKYFPYLGESFDALAVLNASHLDDGCDRRLVLALENPCGHEPRIRGDLTGEQLIEALDASGLVRWIHAPDVDENGTFAHRRTSLSR